MLLQKGGCAPEACLLLREISRFPRQPGGLTGRARLGLVGLGSDLVFLGAWFCQYPLAFLPRLSAFARLRVRENVFPSVRKELG